MKIHGVAGTPAAMTILKQLGERGGVIEPQLYLADLEGNIILPLEFDAPLVVGMSSPECPDEFRAMNIAHGKVPIILLADTPFVYRKERFIEKAHLVDGILTPSGSDVAAIRKVYARARVEVFGDPRIVDDQRFANRKLEGSRGRVLDYLGVTDGVDKQIVCVRGTKQAAMNFSMVLEALDVFENTKDSGLVILTTHPGDKYPGVYQGIEKCAAGKNFRVWPQSGDKNLDPRLAILAADRVITGINTGSSPAAMGKETLCLCYHPVTIGFHEADIPGSGRNFDEKERPFLLHVRSRGELRVVLSKNFEWPCRVKNAMKEWFPPENIPHAHDTASLTQAIERILTLIQETN